MKFCTAGQCHKQVRTKCYTNGQCSDTAVQSQYETGKGEVLY